MPLFCGAIFAQTVRKAGDTARIDYIVAPFMILAEDLARAKATANRLMERIQEDRPDAVGWWCDVNDKPDQVITDAELATLRHDSETRTLPPLNL